MWATKPSQGGEEEGVGEALWSPKHVLIPDREGEADDIDYPATARTQRLSTIPEGVRAIGATSGPPQWQLARG
jgi:hypothetical protein